MTYPLQGIRVLDFSIMYAGPGSAVYLGDMGAEVIKIESPRGDDSRGLGRLTANSFAGTDGSLGLARGGNGLASSVPTV